MEVTCGYQEHVDLRSFVVLPILPVFCSSPLFLVSKNPPLPPQKNAVSSNKKVGSPPQQKACTYFFAQQQIHPWGWGDWEQCGRCTTSRSSPWKGWSFEARSWDARPPRCWWKTSADLRSGEKLNFPPNKWEETNIAGTQPWLWEE